MSKQMHGTGICDCCDGRRKLTPVSLENQPGLDQIAYRVGTHASFKATMLTSIAEQSRLRQLTTRQDDDPSIALIDGWASVLDVLSFYQERIANEGFLSTATERRSVLELARSIGYELSGGVAANTYLTFTVESPRQSTPETNLQLQSQIPDPVIVEKGTKVQSIPGPDELPQIFETSERLEARSCWQDMKVIPDKPITLKGMKELFLKGLYNTLKTGDYLLLVTKTANKNSELTISTMQTLRIVSIKLVTSAWLEQVKQEYTQLTLDGNIRFEPTDVYLWRVQAKHFGYNAPDWKSMPTSFKDGYPGSNANKPEWPSFNISVNISCELDNYYPQIVKGQYLLLKYDSTEILSTIHQAVEITKSDFTLTSKSSRITYQDILCGSPSNYDDINNKRREIVVFADNLKLELLGYKYKKEILNNSLSINKTSVSLRPGQLISIIGSDVQSGKTQGEVCKILYVTQSKNDFTTLTFEKPLIYKYLPESVSVNGNVVPATHGESKVEVLGGGDASQPFQRVMLKQSPLTFVPASTPSGSATTLSVRVNDILWEEVQSLYQQPPDKKCYITRMSDDGQVTVQFGDGINGARVPPGNENIKAEYRTGIGLEGQVKAGQLSMLLTRTNGLKDVINPTAPTGAEDPEKLDQARKNAPMTVLTLDRIVSPQDYEDFALAFAGIAKAKVALLTSGEQTIVHLTVAAPQAKIIPTDSATLRQLKEAIDQARYPRHRVVIDSITESSIKRFGFSARLLIESSYIAEKVELEVRSLLLRAFSFESRQFGQSVSESEITSIVQRVKGVVAVLNVKLSLQSNSVTPSIVATKAQMTSMISPFRIAPNVSAFPSKIRLLRNKRLQAIIIPKVAKIDNQNLKITPAELCVIDPNNLTLTMERA